VVVFRNDFRSVAFSRRFAEKAQKADSNQNTCIFVLIFRFSQFECKAGSGDVGFNPSTQRHYRRLIYYLYCYMFRSYDHHQAENTLIARVTQLTTDPLFYNITNIIVKQRIRCQLSNPSY
jgi:hypothetical protein